MTVKTDGYVPINTSRRVEFQEDTPQDQTQEPIIVDLEEVTQEPVEQQVTQEAPVQEKPKVDQDQHKSRAKKRIKQLLDQNREKDALLEKERKELAELRKQLLDNKKEDKTSLKSRLEANIAMLTKQMTEAIKNGDAEASVVYQDELIDAKMELAAVNHELKQVAAQPESVEKPESKAQNQVPEKALQWIEDHPEFKTDELFHTAAIVINNQLLREGYEANDDDFYEELNARMSKRFPEAFGVQEQNSVQLNQAEKSAKSSEQPVVEDVKDTTQTSKVRTVEQTVSGSSRPSASVSKARKTSVELSPADIAQAERWGLSLEQMARRIAHSEQNKRQDGYVPIHIPTK